MTDLFIKNGIVLTLNETREVLDDGGVVITDNEIEAVGPVDQLEAEYDADRTIDASGHAVLPGFIDAHVHVSDILVRGTGTSRELYDWIQNVKRPAVNEMTDNDHEIAAALFSQEAIQSGITTFVENASGAADGYPESVIERKFAAYEAAGMRNVYAYAFADTEPGPEHATFMEHFRRKEPEVNHVSPSETQTDTDEILADIESLIQTYHGSAAGRQSVWPAPYWTEIVTPEALLGAYELAEKYDVMTTTHTAESVDDEARRAQSSIEYLDNVGYLGERTLLGHCVVLSERDIRKLALTDTKIANNLKTNLALGDGIAPVPQLINYGVTVAVATDNTTANNAANMLSNMAFADLVQKGLHQDATIMTAEKVIEMATIDAARAIGREDDLGSIEPGKLADLVLIDLEYPHLTPNLHTPSTIVYQTQGFEVDTVICNGEIVLEDRTVHGIDEEYPTLRSDVATAAEAISERAGLTSIQQRPWQSKYK